MFTLGNFFTSKLPFHSHCLLPHEDSKLANREYPGSEEISLSLIMKQEGRGQGTKFKRCIGEGNGNPLQYSCLENPRDSGAWWAAVYGVYVYVYVYGVTQSQTQLKRLSSSNSSSSNPLMEKEKRLV